MSFTRKAALIALETLIGGCYAWQTPISRRLVLWDDCPKQNRPQAFLFGGGEETYAWTNPAVPKRTFEVILYAYWDASDPNTVGADLLTDFMDALDAAMAPSGSDVRFGRQTLGNTCYECRVSSKPLKVPGDIDSNHDAMIRVPFTITLP